MNGSSSLNFTTDYVDIFEETVAWIILLIGLPAISLACYALYRLIKADHVAPLYVINLLLSDLVQIICRIYFVSQKHFGFLSPELIKARLIFLVIVRFGLVASLGFMVCISLERYLVVAHPLWYRYRRNLKYTVLTCIFIWLFSVIYAVIDYNIEVYRTFLSVLATLFLLPFPFLLFFYVSSRRALKSTISVSVAEKNRILGALALVFGIYVVLYLPFTFMAFFLVISNIRTYTVYCFMAVARSMVRLSPLVDPFLYIFMRKGARDTLEAFPCFRRVFGWSTTRSDAETPSTLSTGTDIRMRI
uniref:Proteinase-activated receptor 2-like n=1 Tax=Paramormyrops kingsleyae TaxID=1676925 RepID=A0A3B3S6A3_9TELE|nr:proteinase-activated receptor 2-like isoform X2 [Paramormyrops kingsleyae]